MADLCDMPLRMFGPLLYRQRIVAICYIESVFKVHGSKTQVQEQLTICVTVRF
jgi:hypothetical protein